MRITTVLTYGTLALFACRSSNNNSGTDAGSGAGGDGGGSGSGVYTIQDVQNPSMAAGTAVALTGVVVTVIDAYGQKTGDMWVEEPGGGMYSGVHIYNAPLTTVASLAVGDIVDVKGAEKAEYAYSTDTTGRYLVELEPISGGTMTITKTGTATTMPPIAKVSALTIGQMTDVGSNGDRSHAWSAWEGVVIELDDVSALTAPKCITSAGVCKDPTDAEFGMTGDADVESEIAGFPMNGSAYAFASGDCLASVTGVVDYFFDYLILPRTTGDIVTGGTSCPPPENASAGSAVCTDGIDNDGNGFIDCADLGCEVGSAAWVGTDGCPSTDSTCGCSASYGANGIASTNSANASKSGPVYLHDVYITAIDAGYSYWVSDSVNGGANGGIYVFSKPPAGAVIGEQLSSLQGLAGPYEPLTGSGAGSAVGLMELEDATAGAASGSGAIMPLVGQSVATLTGLTSGAPYNSVVVAVGPLKVTAVGTNGQVTLEDSTSAPITMYDEAFYGYGGSGSAAPPYTVGDCYNVTGVMYLYSNSTTKAQLRTINPRMASDVATATCTF